MGSVYCCEIHVSISQVFHVHACAMPLVIGYDDKAPESSMDKFSKV
jgi:hypothetical protein